MSGRPRDFMSFEYISVIIFFSQSNLIIYANNMHKNLHDIKLTDVNKAGSKSGKVYILCLMQLRCTICQHLTVEQPPVRHSFENKERKRLDR